MAFKDAMYSIDHIPAYIDGSWSDNTITVTDYASKTSVTLYIHNKTNANYYFKFIWLAIGF